MTAPKKKQQDGPATSVLFPVKIEGYEIKPWSFGQTVDLMPVWDNVAERLRGSKITMKNAMKQVPVLVKALMPDAPQVCAITLGVDIAEVRDWDISKASIIVLTIVNLNISYLKNLPSLIAQAMEMMES